ncbi:hypothetical protein M513_06614, partial [Trichuris suis]
EVGGDAKSDFAPFELARIGNLFCPFRDKLSQELCDAILQELGTQCTENIVLVSVLFQSDKWFEQTDSTKWLSCVIVAYCGFVFNVSLLLQWSSKFSPFKVEDLNKMDSLCANQTPPPFRYHKATIFQRHFLLKTGDRISSAILRQQKVTEKVLLVGALQSYCYHLIHRLYQGCDIRW